MERAFKVHRPQPARWHGRVLAAPASPETLAAPKAPQPAGPERPKEIGGPSGPEPTRYGDWERKGICVDF